MHPRDHLSYSGGRAGPPTWERARGAMGRMRPCAGLRDTSATPALPCPLWYIYHDTLQVCLP